MFDKIIYFYVLKVNIRQNYIYPTVDIIFYSTLFSKKLWKILCDKVEHYKEQLTAVYNLSIISFLTTKDRNVISSQNDVKGHDIIKPQKMRM